MPVCIEKDLANVAQREAQRLGTPDKPQSDDIRFGVEPIAIGTISAWFQ